MEGRKGMTGMERMGSNDWMGWSLLKGREGGEVRGRRGEKGAFQHFYVCNLSTIRILFMSSDRFVHGPTVQ
jgi:hypothetical protein